MRFKRLLLSGGILCGLGFGVPYVRADQDTNCNSDGNDGTIVDIDYQIDQNDCTGNAIKLGFHPTVNDESAKVLDWKMRIRNFATTDTCARVNDYEVDVDVSGGQFANGDYTEVYMRWYLDREASCKNQLQLQDVFWTCEGATAATTEKAIPNHGWRIEDPEAWSGTEGDYRHVFTLYNREPLVGGLSFYVKDLKFSASRDRFDQDHLKAPFIDWPNIPTHATFTERTLAPGDSMQFQDIYTTGDPVGGNIYFMLEVSNATNTAPEFIAYVRHPTSVDLDIPTVSAWGAVVMGLLIVTAGTIVVVRRRVTG